jgi:hypothetical protein
LLTARGWKWDGMTPRIGLGTIFVDESLLGGTCELWAPSLTEET